uniref:Fibronectin type-III domain-containing protein n=1 Tax=Knipowitschia caucasica TaxID=637954 RepID=A0AAV2L8X3_KNICA
MCCFAAVPAAPVNVSVSQLRADSALVTWSLPPGDTVIGYSLSQQPADPLIQPVDPLIQPVDPLIQPVDPLIQPVDPLIQPVDPLIQPADPLIQPPADPLIQPVDPLIQPVDPLIQPVDPLIQPVDPLIQPVDPLIQPVDPLIQPADPLIQPPVDPLIQPVDPLIQPVDPLIQPVDPLIQPVDPLIQPADPLIQPRQDGLMQRSIREVNTSSHWCMLWDLDEDTHYSVQVQSVGTQGDSQPSRAVQFRTLERSDHYPVGVHDHHHEPAMEGLGMTPHLQTGELLIITTVLLLWAAVIALFCRQYDIIKDNDSNSTKEKSKRLRSSSTFYNGSTGSSPLHHNGAVRSSRVSSRF